MAVMAGYKQTEVGVIPEDWEVSALHNCCCKITDGTHDTPKPVRLGIPFLTAIHVKENKIDYESCLYLTEEDHAIIFRRCNPEMNDVLMVNIGAGVATTALVNVDYEFSLKNVALLKPDSRHAVGAYVNYSLIQRKSKIISDLSSGGAQPFLSLTKIGEIALPLPPTKAEQEAIAEALSDADALIEALEQLIAKKRHLKQGTMQELLTGKKRLPGFSGEWEVKRLGELATFHKGKGLPKSALVAEGKEPCIHYGELFTRYSVTIIEIISYTNTSEGTFRSIANDVLMPTSDVTPRGLAKASCVRTDGVILGGDILVIRSDTKLIFGSFLSYLIRYEEKQVLQLVTGSTVFHLYGTDMKKFTFCMPSLPEQIAIATILSDMDTEIAALESKLAKTRSLKQGMMHNLLTGKVRLV